MLLRLLLSSGNSGVFSVSQTLLFRQTAASKGPAIQSNLSRFHPIEFARATNGYMYFATGLDPVFKWDGMTLQAETAGVPAPAAGPTLTVTGTGSGITGDYSAYVRFLDAAGNVSNLSTVSNTVTAANALSIEYAQVAIPTSSQVVRRQILRNAAGSNLVYYVDIDTTDLFSQTFSSQRDDDDLRQQEIVALFDDEVSANLANFHGIPPNDKPFITYYQLRLWMYGTITYDEGCVSLTNGSTTVTAIGARLTASMVERYLYIDESDRSYEITAVDEEAQTLTIATAYKGKTDLFSDYTIQSIPSRRHLLCYSEPGRPDAWRSSQNVLVASSDDIEDEPTGMVSTQSFLFLLQRRHIYRMTFFTDPIFDGGVFLSARRGCINNRCWVTVDGFLYMLDDRGVFKFDGGDDTEEVSLPIQDLFYFDRPPHELRINWASSKYFHAHHDRNDSTIRWFVAFSGSRYPRHAIAYNYLHQQWWVEEYPFPITDSTLLRQVNPIPIVASTANRVFGVGIGTLDNLDGFDGDNRENATSAGIRTLTAPTSMTLPASLVGVPVVIVDGRGKGQLRTITSVSGQELSVDHNWDIIPDTTSVFQLGGIPWNWRGHWARWDVSDIDQTRRVSASFKPTTSDAQMDVRVYEDYSETPIEWTLSWPRNASASNGVTTTAGSPDAVFDLSQTRGYGYLTLDDLKEYNEYRLDTLSIELKGVSGKDAVQIYAINLEGAQGGG